MFCIFNCKSEEQRAKEKENTSAKGMRNSGDSKANCAKGQQVSPGMVSAMRVENVFVVSGKKRDDRHCQNDRSCKGDRKRIPPA